MTEGYRERLFATYHQTHMVYVDFEGQAKLDWFKQYGQANYLKHLAGYPPANATVLDIGCNQGYLLAALASWGFQQLYGIDLSVADLEKARKIVPGAQLACIDALEYLDRKANSFDVIFLKAVLEHIPKDSILPLLEQVEQSLKPNGIVIIDVPNMDWIFGPHERYMDFTHEVGFTRESLAQVMRNVFERVNVFPGVPLPLNTTKHKIAWQFRPLFIRLTNMILGMVGEGASDVWWHTRSIIAVGAKGESPV